MMKIVTSRAARTELRRQKNDSVVIDRVSMYILLGYQ